MRLPGRLPALTALSAILVFAAAARAACDAPSPAGTRACVFPAVDISPAGEQNGDAVSTVSDALALEVQNAGFQLLAAEAWKEKLAGRDPSSEDFLRGPSAAEVARDAGAELAVTSFFSLQGGRILLSVSFYDATSGTLSGGFQKTWRYTLAFHNGMRMQVRGTLDSLSLGRSGAPAIRAEAPGDTLLDGITFTSSTDDMEILLGGEKSAGSIRGGSLAYPAAGARAGAPLLVEKRKKGYHTSWQTVTTASEIPLSPLARKSWVSYEVSWTLGQLVGAGAALRLFVVPDSVFIAPALSLYGQASGLSGGSAVLHGDFSTVAGVYLFFPPDSLFRLGVSTGVGAIFTGVMGGNVPVYSDLYLNLANIWIELNLPAFTVFLREEIKYAAGIGNNLLGRRLIMIGDFLPPLTLGVSLKV